MHYSVLEDLPKKTTDCSYHSHLPRQIKKKKKKIPFKNTTKSSVKTMDISSLLNTDLGYLND